MMETLAPGRNVAQLSLLSRDQPLIGVRAIERLLRKARRLSGLKILHVNSTRQGGGVAEILSSLTPLMNDVGITTQWHRRLARVFRVYQGHPQRAPRRTPRAYAREHNATPGGCAG
jgi:hypothetical protein